MDKSQAVQRSHHIGSYESGLNMPRVGIVVINYNNYRDTLRLLDSLSKLDYENFFTIVVENCSQNDSLRQLKAGIKDNSINLIQSPTNGGFAAGNNIGIKQAIASGADYLWLLNPDTTVEQDSLTTLIDASKRYPNTTAFGSKVLYGWKDKAGYRIWSAGGVVDQQSGNVEMRGNGVVDKGQFDSETTCDYVPGCSLLVSAKSIETIGYLPEEYFMYFEETDWCTKMKKAGSTLHYIPSSVVYHHFSDDKMQQPLTVYYYNRNKRLFQFRYGKKLRTLGQTTFVDLPRSIKAWIAAPKEMRPVFRAHVKSCVDFYKMILVGK